MNYEQWENTQCNEFSSVSPEAYHAERAWKAALQEAARGGCPHGCTDGNCPWDRRMAELMA